MTTVQLSEVTDKLQKQEIFENDTTIFFTHEVDPAYKAIAAEMAVAIYQHDKGLDKTFPTGDEVVDSPYLCKADDALRAAIPLLRKKFADELAVALKSPEELQREKDAARAAGWRREALEAALKKKNSAHARNRRVRVSEPTRGGVKPPLWYYVRGTCIVIGSLKITI